MAKFSLNPLNWFARGDLEPAYARTRRFAAATLGRSAGDWITTENSINSELQGDLNRLRARGRDLTKNNDYARKFVAMCEDNIVGPEGIRLQARCADGEKLDKIANQAIEDAWHDWGRACDITGTLSFNDLCRHLVGSMPSDGEFLVAMIKGSDAGNPYNFALQIIDVDRIDTTFNGEWNGNTVIMGVEVNHYRKPLAVHLFVAHPSDGLRSSRQRIRVPTDTLLHRFRLERAEQMRGIPWMSAGMLSLHHLGNFKLSALLAAEHGANHYGFFEKTSSDAIGLAVGGVELDGQEVVTNSVPGYYDQLPEGFTFKPYQSQYPNQVFGPFVKTTLQRIASGWRVAYHSLANDLEGVSFSSIRSGTLEERDRWRSDQWWFVGAFCRPVFLAWLEMALLSGAILTPTGKPLPFNKLEKFKVHEWQPRSWEWVDPKNDMEAKILAVNAGLMPPQDLAASMGYDYADTLQLIADAQNLAKQLGISLPAYDSKPGASSAQTQSDKATTKKPPPDKKV